MLLQEEEEGVGHLPDHLVVVEEVVALHQVEEVEVVVLRQEEEVEVVAPHQVEVAEVEVQEQVEVVVVEAQWQPLKPLLYSHHKCSRRSLVVFQSYVSCTRPSGRRPCSSACGGTCAGSGRAAASRCPPCSP